MREWTRAARWRDSWPGLLDRVAVRNTGLLHRYGLQALAAVSDNRRGAMLPNACLLDAPK